MELVLNREGYLFSATHRECVVCSKIYEITCRTITRCKRCNCERVKCTSPEKKMLARAKARAKRYNIDCNIELEDIEIPKLCPVLHIPLICHSGSPGGKPDSPSLDRIDNTKGYIKGNVIVLSHLANMMKSSASTDNLLHFAEWVFYTYKSPASLNEAC